MFAIRSTRPFYLEGKVIAAGEVAMACAADALSAVGSSRAEFMDPSDRAAANDALRASDDAESVRNSPVKSSFWKRKEMNGGY